MAARGPVVRAESDHVRALALGERRQARARPCAQDDVCRHVASELRGAFGEQRLGVRVRSLLADWMPYPPRVETSSLGEAAVLTGALAVGVDAALDNVFLNRSKGQTQPV